MATLLVAFIFVDKIVAIAFATLKIKLSPNVTLTLELTGCSGRNIFCSVFCHLLLRQNLADMVHQKVQAIRVTLRISLRRSLKISFNDCINIHKILSLSLFFLSLSPSLSPYAAYTSVDELLALALGLVEVEPPNGGLAPPDHLLLQARILLS